MIKKTIKKILKKKNFIHSFLDKKFKWIEIFYISSVFFGFTFIINRFLDSKINLFMGFMFILLSVYGYFRDYYLNKK